MTKMQENEIERIRTRFGAIKTRETKCVTIVYVYGDGLHLSPSLVIALDQAGQTVASRKVRGVKAPTESEIAEAMA